MTRINTIKQFSASQESGMICGTHLDSLIATHGTEEYILLLLDGAEANFGNPIKGMVVENMFYCIGKGFIKKLNSFLDEINVGVCDLKEEEIPKTRQEIMEVVILEIKSRMQSIHSINSNHLNLHDYSQGNKSETLWNHTSSRQLFLRK